MTNNLIKNIFVLLLFVTSLSAYEATFDGYVRAGSIVQNLDGAFQDDATSLGGKVGSQAELSRHLELNFGLYFSELLYTTDPLAISGTFVDGDGRSFALLGEASFRGEYQYHSFDFGRQKVDSPHADGDDIRMVPNLFQAYTYRYDGFVNMTFQLTHFTHMSGLDTGLDTRLFFDMHEVMGIRDVNGNKILKGLTMGHIGFEKNHFTFDVYDYYLYDAYNIVYVETTYAKEFSESFTLGLGLQYNANLGDTPHLNAGTLVNTIDAQVLGAHLIFEFGNIGAEIGLSANYGIGRDAINTSWGGGPYYTSLENMTFDAMGEANGLSYAASLSKELFVDGLALSYAYGDFSGADSAIFHLEEHNVALSYEKENVFKFYLGFAQGNDLVTPTNSYDFTYVIMETPLIY